MEFVVPLTRSAESVQALFDEGFVYAGEDCAPCCNRFFDTFDWAVYGDGAVLYQEEATLVWKTLDDDRTCSQRLDSLSIGFADALAAGPVRERLIDVCGIRRLLPVMEVVCSPRRLAILDQNEKTVARVVIARYRVSAGADAVPVELAARISVEPVRGYPEDYQRVCAQLASDPDLHPADGSLFHAALAALGRVPGDYSSRLNIVLDSEQSAEAAVRRILCDLQGTLMANVDGARANLDSEFLHDLRVAVRRTRSILGQVKRVFAAETIDEFKQGFAWLQQATGLVRDLDVYLLAYDDYRASLPDTLASQLEPLRGFLLERHRVEQRRLATALDSERFRRLMHDWNAFLQTAPAHDPLAVNAARPVTEVAGERIYASYKRVRRQGAAISDDSPPEQLHALRKDCKKLRYLMEFFRSLYPGRDIRSLIKQLKTLLDELGDFQDLAVQAEYLREIACQMAKRDHVSVDTLLALGALIGHLLERQLRARGRFEAVFDNFNTAAQHALYQRLFRTDSRSEAGV